MVLIKAVLQEQIRVSVTGSAKWQYQTAGHLTLHIYPAAFEKVRQPKDVDLRDALTYAGT